MVEHFYYPKKAAGGGANPKAMAKEVLESSGERVNAPHEPPDGDGIR